MSDDEPDWTQQKPTRDQVMEWMRKETQVRRYSPASLAVSANHHFGRPAAWFRLALLTKWANMAITGSDEGDTYIVIWLDENGRYVLATNRLFETAEDAFDYVHKTDPKRRSRVIAGRFTELKIDEKAS